MSVAVGNICNGESHPDACTLTDVEVHDERPALGKGAYIMHRLQSKALVALPSSKLTSSSKSGLGGMLHPSVDRRGIEVEAKRVHDRLAVDIKGVNSVPNTSSK